MPAALLATPGPETTALLTLRLARTGFTAVNTPFDKIIDAVQKGKVDGGLIIHEGQLTFADHGLVKIIDLGRWWHRETGLPLPLGLDVVRRDMGLQQARVLARLLRDSIRLAYTQKKPAVQYALRFGRGIDARVGERFVKMYVNKDTLDLGKEGEKALRALYTRAHAQGWLDRVPAFQVIRPD
jgi:1,4-dihydroxy-6-naphthoate synthase